MIQQAHKYYCTCSTCEPSHRESVDIHITHSMTMYCRCMRNDLHTEKTIFVDTNSYTWQKTLLTIHIQDFMLFRNSKGVTGSSRDIHCRMWVFLYMSFIPMCSPISIIMHIQVHAYNLVPVSTDPKHLSLSFWIYNRTQLFHKLLTFWTLSWCGWDVKILSYPSSQGSSLANNHTICQPQARNNPAGLGQRWAVVM